MPLRIKKTGVIARASITPESLERDLQQIMAGHGLELHVQKNDLRRLAPNAAVWSLRARIRLTKAAAGIT